MVVVVMMVVIVVVKSFVGSKANLPLWARMGVCKLNSLEISSVDIILLHLKG